MKKNLLPREPKNRLPTFVTAAVVLGGVNFLLGIFILSAVGQLSQKPSPRLVETPNGVMKTVVALENSEPTPESVRQFVAQTLYGLYDWRGILPPENAEDIGSPKPDPGVSIANGKGVNGPRRKITTATWRHGFRLSDRIRKDVLTQISLITPQDIFTDAPTTQTAMTTPTVGVPQKVEDGLWKVEYKGLLITFPNGNTLGDQIVREHEVYVREIDPLLPVQTGMIDANHVSPIQKVVMEERSYGLVIESMPEKLRNN
jgi:hypothetical protein